MAGFQAGFQQASTTTTSFAGAAIGSAGDRGRWQASIGHDPLSACAAVGASCAITGGTFALSSNNGSSITGDVTGGNVVLTSQAPGCGRQQFAVSASLSTTNGPEALTATLSLIRFQFRGTCTTLLALVQGSLAPDSSGGGGGTL
jgi:hypothetical protein